MLDKTNITNRTLFVGDELEVLRGINSNSVDLIYLNALPTHRGALARQPLSITERRRDWTLDDMRTEWVDEIELLSPDVLTVINAAKVVHGDSMAGYLTFMSVRLLELERLMKATGSIYLHCDPHASHFLRAVMDALFGPENYKNEVICERNRIVRALKRWRQSHDTLLFYTGRRGHRWNPVLMEHD